MVLITTCAACIESREPELHGTNSQLKDTARRKEDDTTYPHKSINEARKSHHREGHGMPLDIPRTICRKINLPTHIITISYHPFTTVEEGWKLTNGAMIPLAFPTVNWNPLAAVLFPYLGQLFGSHASGSPTATYSPMATKKHPR